MLYAYMHILPITCGLFCIFVSLYWLIKWIVYIYLLCPHPYGLVFSPAIGHSHAVIFQTIKAKLLSVVV